MRHLLWASLLVLPLAGGCSRQDGLGPEIVRIKSGDQQGANPGTALNKPLVVEVLGPRRRGLLGGRGARAPVQGCKVKFRVLPPMHGKCRLSGSETVTDCGGLASTTLSVGNVFGDCYVEASIENIHGESKSVIFRAISGVTFSNAWLEGPAGGRVDEPISLTVFDANGQPAQNVPVYFRIEGESQGAKVKPSCVFTDRRGEAATHVTLGGKTGICTIQAEVADSERKELRLRSMRFRVMAVNHRVMCFALLGGLAIFIFGIRQMSEGLQHVAGRRLRAVLRLFTRNRLVGVAVGAGVTALIQSSSACTVMVVGFVNAGLLTLTQAIGVVFGANIGTTITAQIIALKLTYLAYPAIALGLLIVMISRKKQWRFWGEVILGFGMLFLGMKIMSSTLKPLRHSPTFVSFFQGFDCSPVNGVMPPNTVLYAVLIGAAMTMIIQSSSATIGLAMALAGSGLINFYTAVPIILGDNIGTTITAVLASLGANRTAKQTACAHALFNIFGAAYMFVLFYVPLNGIPVFLNIVERILPGTVLAENPQNIERHIAMAHSLFNIANVIVFLPFVGVLAHLCTKIVPAGAEEDEGKLQYLEPHLLDMPSLALEQAVKEVAFTTRLAGKAIQESFRCFMDEDISRRDKLARREERIDRLQADITDYLVQLAQRELTETESQLLPGLVHAVNDAERIGDHSENILELAERRIERKLPFTDAALRELEEFSQLVQAQLEDTAHALEAGDRDAAQRALELEERINALTDALSSNHVRRLESGQCNVVSGVVFLDLIANFEKVGDHLTNIAERAKLAVELMEAPT